MDEASNAAVRTRQVTRVAWHRAQARFLWFRSLTDASYRAGDPRITWVMIYTLPNAGSTAVASYLRTAGNVEGLTENAEGQWLVPALREDGLRWDETHVPKPREVRAIWLSRAQQIRGDRDSLTIIEKSPPNLVRPQLFAAALKGMRTATVRLQRDPLPTIASWHKRYGREQIRPTPTSDDAYFAALAALWLERTRLLHRIPVDIVWSYRDFVENPAARVRELLPTVPDLRDVEPDGLVQVKDYPPQPLANMDAQSVEALTPDQRAIIQRSLHASETWLHECGYSTA